MIVATNSRKLFLYLNRVGKMGDYSDKEYDKKSLQKVETVKKVYKLNAKKVYYKQ